MFIAKDDKVDNIREYTESDYIMKYIIDNISKIVEIPSIIQNPEMIMKVLETFLGFAENNRYQIEKEENYGCIIYPGCIRGLEIGIFTHLDVVPAGEGWNFEPYRLTKKEGLLIGRGTLDDKGPAVVALAAMNYFASHHIELPFSIRLFLGGQEESGMGDVKKFLQTHCAPQFSVTPDNMFPVGIGESSMAMIAITTEVDGDILTFMGKIINPRMGYARVILAETVPIIYPSPFIRQKGNVIETVINNLEASNCIEMMTNFLLDNHLVFGKSKKALELISKLSVLQNLSYAEMNKRNYLYLRPNEIHIKDRKLIIKYYVRYHVLNCIENIVHYLKEFLYSFQYELEIISEHGGVYVDPDRHEVQLLLKAYNKVTGFNGNVYFDNYGTYAARMPNTVAFGVREIEPHSLLGDGRGNMHQKDEYITVNEVKVALETYIRAILYLAEYYEEEKG